MPRNTDLSRFPRPNVAVDVAVLTALPSRPGRPGTLAVLVQDRDETSIGRVLPGRFLREGQTVADCVADALRIKAGLERVKVEVRLLRVFDAPDRDPRAWTLSLAHSLTLPPDRLEQAAGQLLPVTATGELGTGEPLMFDHEAIVREAAAAIRERYEQLPDPDGLQTGPFTMAELRSVHEAVLGGQLLKDTFRRRMEPSLMPVAESDGSPALRSDGGRPAQLYARNQDMPLSPAAQRRLLLPRSRR